MTHTHSTHLAGVSSQIAAGGIIEQPASVVKAA
jgi:hypothetical protein